MKAKLILALLLLFVVFVQANAQELPPKHRGMHPQLKADGKVYDMHGKQLGYITKEGKICDVTGKVIGIISKSGEVTTGNGKEIIGVIQKDKSFKSRKGYVVTDEDGILKVQGKEVAKVDQGYKYKDHACVVHCFFSTESEDAGEIDENIEN
ncbi:MAG TPA: hypothetical protein VFW11_05410 [Cyclobacteriaceae bacterium]|nr:hypothetical protein [Cyclobacteriaceae bacterium]